LLTDLQDNEKEWLSEHLGPTLIVYKSYNHLQEPFVEMPHLSWLLLATESGQALQYEAWHDSMAGLPSSLGVNIDSTMPFNYNVDNAGKTVTVLLHPCPPPHPEIDHVGRCQDGRN
jgi:hypothetical protein